MVLPNRLFCVQKAHYIRDPGFAGCDGVPLRFYFIDELDTNFVYLSQLLRYRSNYYYYYYPGDTAAAAHVVGADCLPDGRPFAPFASMPIPKTSSSSS